MPEKGDTVHIDGTKIKGIFFRAQVEIDMVLSKGVVFAFDSGTMNVMGSRCVIIEKILNFKKIQHNGDMSEFPAEKLLGK